MLLKNKVAVVYGAAGAIGGVAARAFAREGARVFLTGRRLAPVEAISREIVAVGGTAEAAEVDALDAEAVEKHLKSLVAKAGRVDISFNAVGLLHATTVPVRGAAARPAPRPYRASTSPTSSPVSGTQSGSTSSLPMPCASPAGGPDPVMRIHRGRLRSPSCPAPA